MGGFVGVESEEWRKDGWMNGWMVWLVLVGRNWISLVIKVDGAYLLTPSGDPHGLKPIR